jgi:glyoxylate utilization-related uncharacterized protein
MKLMSVVNAISAWVLAVCFLLFVITGFDIQLRIISPSLSSFIHLKYLFVPAQLAFMFHTSYAVRFSLIRRKFWNLAGKSLFGLYIAVNLAVFYLFLAIHLF